MKNFHILIATWFYLGKFPKMPGTIGSLGAFPLIFIISINHYLGLLLLFFLCIIGFYSINTYLKEIKSSDDPKEIVIDEVIGQLLTVFLVSIFLNHILITLPISQLIIAYIKIFIVSFLFFRLFDITKLWPISFIDKNIKGPIGIILDDILAAFFAYLLIAILCVTVPSNYFTIFIT